MKDDGEPFVMITSTTPKQLLPAACLVSKMACEPDTEPVGGIFGWMMSVVMGLNPKFLTVFITALEIMIVVIMKTLESSAQTSQVYFHLCDA